MSAPVPLRAHNLLCIQGFVGKGYSPSFVAHMTRVVDGLHADAPVRVLAEPDTLCGACPHRGPAGCTLHGDGTEATIVAQDRAVARRLGIEPGTVVRWGEVLARIRAAVAPADLEGLCGTCPWLPLGVCAAGLRRLRDAVPQAGR